MNVTIGSRSAYLAEPARPVGRGVLVIHEAYGLNDDIRRIADRFASEGYLALAPDLYGGGPLCVARTLLQATRDQAAGRPAEDLAGWRQWLRDRHGVERCAVIGFCLGGGFALAHAASGGEVEAVAVNYGTVRVDLSRVCPVVASYGALDTPFLGHARRLEAELPRLGIEHDVKIYPGVGHSFMNQHEGWPARLERLPSPLHPGYDAAAAEDAWQRILAFFGRHLAA